MLMLVQGCPSSPLLLTSNNSNVPIEVMVFIFYSDTFAIDVKTGLITRHKN